MKYKNVMFNFIVAVALVASMAVAGSAKDKISVGGTMENFKLTDINGKEQSFNDLKGKNGTVVLFLSTVCPVCKGYEKRVRQLADDYKAKGINFVGIFSNYNETPEEIKKHAGETIQFPALLDQDSAIADKLSVSATSETFFFDAGNKLIYSGAIDNDRTGANVTMTYLRAAIDESLAGKAVSKPKTPAIGCAIVKKS